jgi:hypothetical protein
MQTVHCSKIAPSMLILPAICFQFPMEYMAMQIAVNRND